MSKSIMQTIKQCYISKATTGLHKHHIYAGSNRQISEQNGFWVWLRGDWHNLSNYGVHFDKDLDLRLKQECQRKYEKNHTRQEFISLIGKNYLN